MEDESITISSIDEEDPEDFQIDSKSNLKAKSTDTDKLSIDQIKEDCITELTPSQTQS